MKLIRLNIIVILMLICTSTLSAQVDLLPQENKRSFSIKLTHLASMDFVLLVCDKQTGVVEMKMKEGTVLRTTDFNEIINTTSSVSSRFASFVSTTEQKLSIKYEIANFNVKVGRLYGRF